jgi:retinol-binding protein 3
MTIARTFSLMLCLFSGCSPSHPNVTGRHEQREIVDAIAARLEAIYVSPELAQVARQRLAAQLESGAYGSSSRRQLADRLTVDLQAATHDKHVRVSSTVEPPPLRDTRHSKIFGSVERQGNVGFAEVMSFGVPPELAGEEIARTMCSLADVRALVFDLSSNGGGHPGTVALLASYLFGDEPVHLNTMVDRASGIRDESFTDPHVVSCKFGLKKPVFVIIGPRTFSGAEEFTYDLQALRRITVIGEQSGGGANSGGFEPLPHDFSAFIPSRRPVNPVTKTNWEGVGVRPDVPVAESEARTIAMRMATETL